MTWGTGALNIDKSRVGGDAGRWPANIILDEHAAEALDEQSGVLQVGPKKVSFKNKPDMVYDGGWSEGEHRGYGDSGGASRFFYIAKASRAERDAGLEGMEVRKVESDFRQGGMANPRDTGNYAHRANHHPTVKPLKLMRYLVLLVTPPGGIVLDPFMGSGSTGCAVVQEDMQFIGIDLNPEYVEIAEKRIAYWKEQNPLNI
jgi:site-specific DNA-methyltransferase (adenine-specific)